MRRPTRRIARWTVALGAAVAVATPASASATTYTDGAREYQQEFRCGPLEWVDEGVLEGTECSPQEVGPIVDPFVISGWMPGGPVFFDCLEGFAAAETVRGSECTQR